eukprot:12903074-Prorocentrum_lima.AAC.1
MWWLPRQRLPLRVVGCCHRSAGRGCAGCHPHRGQLGGVPTQPVFPPGEEGQAPGGAVGACPAGRPDPPAPPARGG